MSTSQNNHQNENEQLVDLIEEFPEDVQIPKTKKKSKKNRWKKEMLRFITKQDDTDKQPQNKKQKKKIRLVIIEK